MPARVLIAIACCIVVRSASAGGCGIPLESTRSAFVVSVSVRSGHAHRFLFDTGSSISVITPELASRIGASISGSTRAITTSGPVTVGRARLEDVRIGTLRVALMDVLVVPLPRFPSHGSIDGIIGADILAGRGYRIDVRGRCLHLDAVATAGTVVAAQEIAGRIVLKAGEMNLVLDSGASFPVLLSGRARALASPDEFLEMTTASGRETVRSGVIDRFTIGDATLRDVRVAFGPQLDPREDALIPINLFREIYVAADRRSVVIR